ncbi:MAG: hypothetical protein D8H97_32360 [Neisseria sp.]|nr:MAG: hypothetical protein D8H97_32360 [Neisseria sp.]
MRLSVRHVIACFLGNIDLYFYFNMVAYFSTSIAHSSKHGLWSNYPPFDFSTVLQHFIRILCA